MSESLPPEYKRFVIEEVRTEKEMLILAYGGRVFGGVVRCELAEGIESALRPGEEIFVRYHDEETGRPGQIAHLVIRSPSATGWAEIFCDS